MTNGLSQIQLAQYLAQNTGQIGNYANNYYSNPLSLNNTSIFNNLLYNSNRNVTNSSNCYQNYTLPSLNLSYKIRQFLQFIMMQMFMKYFIQMMGKLFNNQNVQNVQTDTTSTAQGTANNGNIRNTPQDIINLTNSDSALKNQKGTSYVIVSGSACSRCKKFDPIAKQINNELGTNATFFSLNPESKEASKLYSKLKTAAGAENKSYGYPIIIKCVDGNPTEFYSYSDISGIYTNKDKMKEWFAGKIQ